MSPPKQPTDTQALPIDVPARGGTLINPSLLLLRSDGRCAVMRGSVALHVWDEGDRIGERICLVSLVTAGLATRREVAAAFGVHENTAQRLVRQGLAALVPARRGPKGPSKVTGEVHKHIEEAHHDGLRGPQIQAWLRDRFGIVLSRSTVFAVVHEITRGEMTQPALELNDIEKDSGGGAEAREAAAETSPPPPAGRSSGGAEPPVVVPEIDHGRYMGLTLYYPALAAVGLVPTAQSTLRLRWAERFGIRAVILTIFFLSLLRKTTLESAKHLRRLEFGAVVGSGRAPCVKTLRRKLVELGALGQAANFGAGLARHWVESTLVSTATLYVDGHVKLYTGKRQLEEAWSAQRRRPLPAVVSCFVGDQRGRPLLIVNEGVSASLTKSLPAVVRAVRQVIGDRPLTLVFDRGGYSGKLFTWLREQHIDFITYQRGRVSLPESHFRGTTVLFEGRRVSVVLAEDEEMVKGGSGPWRRIVVRTERGEQVPILTSLPKSVDAARISCLIGVRWRQENLFRYMRQHHGLDTLVSHAWRDAGDHLIPNPGYKRLTEAITAKRAELRTLHAELGSALLSDGHADATQMEELVRSRSEKLEVEIKASLLQRRITPRMVSASTAGRTREILELERKHLVDDIKLAAYNAELWLLERLVPHYHNPFDARDLLRAFAELPGSIHTTPHAVVVTLDPPDTPAHRAALRGLCADVNQLETAFPGTSLPVRYAVRAHHSERAV